MTQKLAVYPALRSAWLIPLGASVGQDGPPKYGPHPGGYVANVRSASGGGLGLAWGCAACSDGVNLTAEIVSLVRAPSAGATSGCSSHPCGFVRRSSGFKIVSFSYCGGLTGGKGTGASGSIPDAIAARRRSSSSCLTSLSMPTSPMSRLPSPKSLS